MSSGDVSLSIVATTYFVSFLAYIYDVTWKPDPVMSMKKGLRGDGPATLKMKRLLEPLLLTLGIESENSA